MFIDSDRIKLENPLGTHVTVDVGNPVCLGWYGLCPNAYDLSSQQRNTTFRASCEETLLPYTFEVVPRSLRSCRRATCCAVQAGITSGLTPKQMRNKIKT